MSGKPYRFQECWAGCVLDPPDRYQVCWISGLEGMTDADMFCPGPGRPAADLPANGSKNLQQRLTAFHEYSARYQPFSLPAGGNSQQGSRRSEEHTSDLQSRGPLVCR